MIAVRWLLALPLGVQALAMLIDELHFHRRRGLGAWERIGHPLDTMTVLGCLTFALLVPPTDRAIAAYLGLSLLSCLFITKDEAIHAGCCRAGEHWLHAILFVVHPMTLASVGLMWPAIHVPHDAVPGWLHGVPAASIVTMQIVVTSLFCVYQILYWNLPWPRRTSIAP